jgi:nucleoside-diphosphate kinase
VSEATSARTLVLVKPDGVARGLVGEVISRLEAKGLRLVAAELRTLTREVAEEHYGEHREKPFFGSLVEFITGGALLALVVEGPRAVEAFRALAGATDPVKAAPGHHPWRLRPRGAEQHRARLGLRRVRRARDRAVLPEAGLSPSARSAHSSSSAR